MHASREVLNLLILFIYKENVEHSHKVTVCKKSNQKIKLIKKI